jgi:hypothetical protein
VGPPDEIRPNLVGFHWLLGSTLLPITTKITASPTWKLVQQNPELPSYSSSSPSANSIYRSEGMYEISLPSFRSRCRMTCPTAPSSSCCHLSRPLSRVPRSYPHVMSWLRLCLCAGHGYVYAHGSMRMLLQYLRSGDSPHLYLVLALVVQYHSCMCELT